MRDRTFERIGALSGLAFVALAALSGFIYPQQPRVDAGPAKTLAWVHDHHVALQAGMIFDFFAAGALLWFVGYLHRVLRRAEGEVESLSPIVFAAGIGVAITTAMAALPTVLLAFMDAQPGGVGRSVTGPRARRPEHDLLLRHLRHDGRLPRRARVGDAARPARECGGSAGSCCVVAAFNAIAVWIGVTFSSYHGRAWLIIGWGAYVGFLIVMLITSASMLRQPRTAPTAPATTSPSATTAPPAPGVPAPASAP